jgi:hypothetical protein
MAYAEGTKVSVEKSQDEIRALLARHGCKQFALFSGENKDAIQFVLAGLPYRFEVLRPTRKEVQERWAQAGRRVSLVYDWDSKVQGEWRRRWRARLLWLKATLEFAEDDEQFIAQALMSQLVLPDQSTFGEWAEKKMPEIYSTGRLPALPMFDAE